MYAHGMCDLSTFFVRSRGAGPGGQVVFMSARKLPRRILRLLQEGNWLRSADCASHLKGQGAKYK